MKNRATLRAEPDHQNVYRVEATIDDGRMEVAVFSGPNALRRATAFASSNYYHGFDNPQGLVPT